QVDWISMSFTSTSSSWPIWKNFSRTAAGSRRIPENTSRYARATRAGVSCSPGRSGSSPTAMRNSRIAAAARSSSYSGAFVYSGTSRSGSLILRLRVRRGGRIGDVVVRHVGGAGLGSDGDLPCGDVHLRGHAHRWDVGDRSALAGEPHGPRLAFDDGFEHLGEFLVQSLLLQQRGREVIEDLPVLGEDLPRFVVRGLDEAAHLFVDEAGDFLGVLPFVAHVPAEEDFPVSLPEP